MLYYKMNANASELIKEIKLKYKSMYQKMHEIEDLRKDIKSLEKIYSKLVNTIGLEIGMNLATVDVNGNVSIVILLETITYTVDRLH